jgi:hypothetical protein
MILAISLVHSSSRVLAIRVRLLLGEYGYVPTTHATAYVHVKSDWIAAKKWDGIGYPKTLSELKSAVERFATAITGH